MKSKGRGVVELEAELLRLNNMVRARRAQLARLETCPNKGCECRKVWREVVEHKLASQVRRIRKNVKGKAAGKNTPRANGKARTSARRPAPVARRGTTR